MPFQEVYDSAEVTEAAEEVPHRPYYGIKFEGSGDPRALKFVASKEEVDADQGASSIPRPNQLILPTTFFFSKSQQSRKIIIPKAKFMI